MIRLVSVKGRVKSLEFELSNEKIETQKVYVEVEEIEIESNIFFNKKENNIKKFMIAESEEVTICICIEFPEKNKKSYKKNYLESLIKKLDIGKKIQVEFENNNNKDNCFNIKSLKKFSIV